MKNHGFKNEKKLIKALNNHYFSELSYNLKRLIEQSFQNYRGKISCYADAGVNKSDIRIKIGNESHTYSIKMGKGNSIHQEPLEGFLDFLEQKYALDAQTKEKIERFIWADGTRDGTGAIKKRINARKFKKQHPQTIKAIQHYFETIKTPLLRRFLIEGVKSHHPAEFIYYGTVKKGVVCRSEDVLKWVASHEAKGVLHLGKLTFQAWNRNLKGKRKAERKRGIIQLKWGGLKRDIKKIAKINLGKRQEIAFVQQLNKKEKLSYWQQLGLNPNEHYAIRVKYPKYGTLHQRKVWAKADAFIAKGSVPHHYLKLNHYFLDEDDVKRFHLMPIEQTGISIKQPCSRDYQIVKISPSSFKKLFGSNILAAGASLYYKKRKKLPLNQKILKAWGIAQEDFFAYYAKALQLPIDSVTHINCQKCLKKIKRYAKKEIAKTIKSNQSISDFIFYGIGNFQEPFTAPWLFEHGVFQKNYRIPFTVSTGSGRSRGRCTIVIKPK